MRAQRPLLRTDPHTTRLMKRIGIFTTHPIQYQAPLWRMLANDQRFATKVFYFSDHGATARVDSGFGESFTWDVPLLEGYDHEFLFRLPIEQAAKATIPDLHAFFQRQRLDAVLIHGYASAHSRQLLSHAGKQGYRCIMRGEFTTLSNRSTLARPQWLKAMYLRHMYRKVDLFSSIGVDANAHLRSHGVPEERIVVAPYSVDDEHIEAQRALFDRSHCRALLGLPEDVVLVLFSGKLIPRKQPLMLARAIARLPSLQRVAACFLGSGILRSEIETALRPLLGSRLMMPGFVNQSQLGKYFAAADVFALPSAYDTWGLVVNEAMHWGLPCVVSDRTGCHADLVVEGQTGFVHPWNDTYALSTVLEKLVIDPHLRFAMGRHGREHVQGYRMAVTASALGVTFERAFA